MAIRRVLVLIQVGGCAGGRLSPPVTLGAARLGRRDKHTPKATQPNQKARKQSDDGRGVRAKPLANRPAHTVALIFVFISSFMACPSQPYLPLSLSPSDKISVFSYQSSRNKKSARCTMRTPSSLLPAYSSNVTTYFG